MIRKLPYLLPIFFFIVYSHPLWSPRPIHPSLIEQDRLNHEIFDDYFADEEVHFFKYGPGAYFLDWIVAAPLAKSAEGVEDRIVYHNALGRVSAWYHCLLAALSVLLVFKIVRQYQSASQSIFATIFYGFCPAVAYWACSAGTNIPFLFFGLFALFALGKWVQNESCFWAVLCGLFSAFSLMYKEFFGLFMLVFPLLIWEETRRDGRGLKIDGTFIGQGAAFFASFLIAFSFFSLLWKDTSLYMEHLSAYFGKIGLEGPNDLLEEPQSILLWIFPTAISLILIVSHSLPGAIMAVWGGRRIGRDKTERILLLLLPVAFYFVFFVVRYSGCNYPYLLVFVPLVAAAVSAGLKSASAHHNTTIKKIGIVFAYLALGAIALQTILMEIDIVSDPRIQVEQHFAVLAKGRQSADFSVAAITAQGTGPRHYHTRRLTVIEPKFFDKDQLEKLQPDYLVVENSSVDAFLNSSGSDDAKDRVLMFPKLEMRLLERFGNHRRFWKQNFNGLNSTFYIYEKGKPEDDPV